MDFEKLNKTLNEALDNYHDQRKWEAFIIELEDCYDHGAHTAAYLEICKFFKYNDLVQIFTRLKQYRDKHGGYDVGSPEADEQYTTFEQMMDRLEKEIPSTEDYELIRSYL